MNIVQIYDTELHSLELMRAKSWCLVF